MHGIVWKERCTDMEHGTRDTGRELWAHHLCASFCCAIAACEAITLIVSLSGCCIECLDEKQPRGVWKSGKRGEVEREGESEIERERERERERGRAGNSILFEKRYIDFLK